MWDDDSFNDDGGDQPPDFPPFEPTDLDYPFWLIDPDPDEALDYEDLVIPEFEIREMPDWWPDTRPEWMLTDDEMGDRGDISQHGGYVVDLSDIPADYEGRAKVFATAEDAIEYLRRGGILNFSLVAYDPETGLYRAYVGDSK